MMIAATTTTTSSGGGINLIFTLLPILFIFLPLLLPILCGVIGRIMENKHYESIRLRELASERMLVIPTPVANTSKEVTSATMVIGAMVVSPDSFRRFLSGIRKIFGGRLRSYESMLDRARREAVLRMKEQAPGADAIVNFRMETSKIGGQENKKGIIAIEVLAYGTAITYGNPS